MCVLGGSHLEGLMKFLLIVTRREPAGGNWIISDTVQTNFNQDLYLHSSALLYCQYQLDEIKTPKNCHHNIVKSFWKVMKGICGYTVSNSKVLPTVAGRSQQSLQMCLDFHLLILPILLVDFLLIGQSVLHYTKILPPGSYLFCYGNFTTKPISLWIYTYKLKTTDSKNNQSISKINYKVW